MSINIPKKFPVNSTLLRGVSVCGRFICGRGLSCIDGCGFGRRGLGFTVGCGLIATDGHSSTSTGGSGLSGPIVGGVRP